MIYQGINYLLNAPYTNEATVSGNASASGAVTIPTSFISGGKTYKVTVVAANAFLNDTNITSLVLPAGLKTIRFGAFTNSVLTQVTIPSSVNNIETNIFFNCANLTTVNWNTLFGNIPNNTFENCVSLSSFTIPSTVYNIGSEAFKGSGVVSITMPNNILITSTGTFQNCTSLTSLTLPAYLTLIGYKLCSGCTSLTSITIPQYVDTISSRAFENTGLASIVLPQSVKLVGADSFDLGNVFANCTALTSMVWSPSCNTIYDNMFLNCSNLFAITVYNSTTNVITTAFDGCTKLKTFGSPGDYYSDFAAGPSYDYFTNPVNGFYLTFYLLNVSQYTDPANNVLYYLNGDNFTAQVSYSPFLSTDMVTIPSTVNDGSNNYTVKSVAPSAFQGKAIKKIVLPNTVTFIGAGAFEQCSLLATITLPTGLTVIPNNCFNLCPKITSLAFLPSTITYIGNVAFRSNTGLTSAIIPANVKFISRETFRFCSNLATITFPSGLKLISDYSFQQCTSLVTVNFPNGLSYVDNLAFASCTSLTTVNAPKSLLTIGPSAFKNCTSMTAFNFF